MPQRIAEAPPTFHESSTTTSRVLKSPVILHEGELLLDPTAEAIAMTDSSYLLFSFRKGIRFSKKSYNFVKLKFITKGLISPQE